jgi:hypothetical protein
MLKKSTFGSLHRTLASSLLVLVIAALGSVANAQSNEPIQVKTPDSVADSNSTSGENTSGLSSGSSSGVCVRPEHWLYAEAYEEGQMVSHGSKVWKSVKETSGDMPGMSKSPRWELVEDHCSMDEQ